MSLPRRPPSFGFRPNALNLRGTMPRLSPTGCRTQLANALREEFQLRLNQYKFTLPYVGADAIAATLNPSNPSAAQTPAARQFIRTLEEHIVQKKSFVCESTLSGLTMQKFVASARDAEYAISVAFLFVDSADVCVARVAERVRAGGHNVPEADIRRRFRRSIRNFWTIYRELADNWVLLYNGMTTLQDVAVGSGNQSVVRDAEMFATFLDIVGELP